RSGCDFYIPVRDNAYQRSFLHYWQHVDFMPLQQKSSICCSIIGIDCNRRLPHPIHYQHNTAPDSSFEQ
ncbi:MAG: hypothetical protein PVI49_05525, partial [Desulfobacterales bacterium]